MFLKALLSAKIGSNLRTLMNLNGFYCGLELYHRIPLWPGNNLCVGTLPSLENISPDL